MPLESFANIVLLRVPSISVPVNARMWLALDPNSTEVELLVSDLLQVGQCTYFNTENAIVNV